MINVPNSIFHSISSCTALPWCEPSDHDDEIGYQALNLMQCGTPSYRSTTNFTPWCGETEIYQDTAQHFHPGWDRTAVVCRGALYANYCTVKFAKDLDYPDNLQRTKTVLTGLNLVIF